MQVLVARLFRPFVLDAAAATVSIGFVYLAGTSGEKLVWGALAIGWIVRGIASWQVLRFGVRLIERGYGHLSLSEVRSLFARAREILSRLPPADEVQAAMGSQRLGVDEIMSVIQQVSR